jgi:aspartyl-tRNA(Asn)/glutamyl-tRNA(Gln) amidotransferase subunit B
VPLQVDQAWIVRVSQEVPELPEAKRQRLMSQYDLPPYDAEVLTASRSLAEYFEATVQLYNQPKVVSNWIMGDFMRQLNRSHLTPSQSPVTPAHLAGLLQLVDVGEISGKMAKTVFDEMFQSGKSARDVVRDLGLVQMNDSGALQEIIARILAAHPQQVQDYRAGKHKLLGFFVGQIMKATEGKANPKLVHEVLSQGLSTED